VIAVKIAGVTIPSLPSFVAMMESVSGGVLLADDIVLTELVSSATTVD